MKPEPRLRSKTDLRDKPEKQPRAEESGRDSQAAMKSARTRRDEAA